MIVVKIGGGGGVDLKSCCADIAAACATGERVAVLHGGSDVATRLAQDLGHPPRFITAPSGVRSRYTDARTLEIFTMALAGLNSRIVACLQAHGVDAVGLSGVDGRALEGRRKEAVVTIESDGRRRVIRDDRSGTVERVNRGLLCGLLERGYVPVLSPPASSPDGPINVDADRAAACVATTLGARALVLLTNVPGLLRDRDDPASLIPHVQPTALDEAMALAAGRMRVKILAARAAVEGGVPRVIIGDGRRDRPIARALDGEGTVISGE